MSAAERTFWRSDTCTVWVGRNDSGALEFTGYDRAHLDGYEYVITVAPEQFAVLRQALAATEAEDIVDLVCAHVDDIMARGERTWLTDRGIEHSFGSY
ncbi:hypothetical protein [Mycobacterium deserti]|uniref:Uncharacterized protein n=1 Tax=Mycobacterium deserti TaxID=2978347 RepID=A0ABT2M9B1_9MYCO|nr:hypothetical protein [Mycobacterium deserti]MCT7658853.1 hypothetical protein [Mycobacterium deserti]